MIISRCAIIFVGIFLLMGCVTTTNESPVFSPTSPSAEVINQELIDNSSSIRWAGIIVDAVNESSGTIFEILSYPVNSKGRPKLELASEGRFIVRSTEYFELVDYAPGRLVQVYGNAVKWQASSLSEDIKHPVVEAKRINLLPVKEEGSGYSNFRFGLGINLRH